MSKLEELIQKLCPNGVEYRPLGEVVVFNRGKAITQKDIKNGEIPVIAGGQKPAYYCNEHNRTGETIVIAGSGAYAGYVSYWNEPIFVSDAFSVDIIDNQLLPRFLFHFLLNNQNYIYAKKKGSGVPHVYGKDISNLRIPVPPIEVQEEIVRILDKFTELSAELSARKKQYEFYRDNILNFSNCNDVPKHKLTEIFNTRNGYTPSKNNKQFWNTSEISWFRMDDIRENGRILDKAIQGVSISAVKGKPFPKNSIIVSTSATIGEHALIKCESLANQRFTYLMLKDEYKDKYNIMFLFYYCFVLDEYCKENLNQGNFASVDMRKFNEFEFPMPSLEEQKRIVAILDRFDKLCNDISEGLPAEIEARQKQYEYYRDKLLTFEEIAQ